MSAQGHKGQISGKMKKFVALSPNNFDESGWNFGLAGNFINSIAYDSNPFTFEDQLE